MVINVSLGRDEDYTPASRGEKGLNRQQNEGRVNLHTALCFPLFPADTLQKRRSEQEVSILCVHLKLRESANVLARAYQHNQRTGDKVDRLNG